MLHIHFSNRIETLTTLLLARLAARGGGVFDADQVIVPGAAQRRWLTLAIARERGICANVQFPYLAAWLWQQIRALLPALAGAAPIEPAVLGWRVHALLTDDGFVTAHPPLAAYLAQADAVMVYELAQRIAALFEQYAAYRPDWLDAWRHGMTIDAAAAPAAVPAAERADERWQAALWQRLCAAPGPVPLDQGAALIAALQQVAVDSARAAGLPAQAHVFALPAMAPLHLAWLQQIARLVEIHVYVLNPCREYWFEIIDRRRLSWLAARGREHGHEEGNRLLAAWGRQTQSFVEGLVDACGEGATDDAGFVAAPADSLLARLQNAVLDLSELTPGSVAVAPDDRSIEIHVCHSLTRELEVLHDRLLGLFASGAVRHPSEILVVTPDLDAAAPLIDAVFGTAPPSRQIAYTISGRARSRANAPARALLALLALAASRFAASEVIGLLQHEIVARRFGLAGDAMQQLHEWLRAAAVRWGLDGPHRADFGVPAADDHSWAQALDRLFLGYALPTRTDEPFAGLLGAGDVEGSDAPLLGALWHFIDRLRALRATLATAHPPLAWRALLLDTARAFMAPVGDEIDELAELDTAIGELAAAMQRGGAGALPLPVLRHALEQQLDDPAHGGVPGGGVTFTAMSSLRGLPYAVVCMIGLDDGAFPTAARPAEFDLIALHPRRGDRQRRSDERNLFLDLLLAARHCLHLSHTGRSVRDNAPLPPSVLVSDLLDLLTAAIAADPASAASLAEARARLVVEHPMQPFSAEAFAVDGDPRRRSFDRELGDALRRSLRAPAAPPVHAAGAGADLDDDDEEAVVEPLPAFFDRPLPPPEPPWREVSLDQLVEFFRNPCRYLLRRRLEMTLVRAEEELADDEPFVPDWPGRTALAERLLAPLLAGADAAALRRLAVAGRDLPAGAIGRQQLELSLRSLQSFAERIRAETAAACLPPHHISLDVEIDGEDWRVQAAFADLRPQGLVRWRADELRATDRLAAWLAHLMLCTAPPIGVTPHTRWLALDQTLDLAAPPDARALLVDLLRLYRRGLSAPLEFFPKSAWSYVENGESFCTAAQAWTPTKYRPFAEGADSAYRLALRGIDDPLGGEFAALACAVFDPLVAAIGPKP